MSLPCPLDRYCELLGEATRVFAALLVVAVLLLLLVLLACAWVCVGARNSRRSRAGA